MKSIKKNLMAALTIVAMSFTTSSFADGLLGLGEDDLAGPYIGAKISMNGIELDGSATNDGGEVTNGTMGSVFMAAGADGGWSLSVNDLFNIGIGASLLPGSAKMKGDANSATDKDITLEVEDLYSAYIRPAYQLTDTSEIYAKVGLNYAEMSVTGNVVDPNSSIRGEMYAVGSRILLDSGFYLETEAGLHAFDKIEIIASSGGKATADPNIAYGAITIGKSF